MATSRIARFVMEAAPPQYISVMRHRTSKMLDTIKEEEREVSPNDSLISSPKSLSSSSSLSLATASASASSSSSSAVTATANSKYFLKEVHRSLSNLNH
ncbi:Galactosyltransferase family protein [Quillaja saponaria]|uniref:Galactosyltransferase family protein n=1 Tax=Quillaja saponaria TaxID=32244 RepID=A0AAD7M385_QUISA|nr:Galactosyltransferase family protein [Quillaja saponaria]